MTPRITVAVCTWNRAKSLQRALESIATAVAALGRPIQLVVVNNNCTDDTDSVIAGIARQLAVTHIHEPRPGLAHARNAATAVADGDYIVWTDDDVVVSAGWLAAYSSAFIEHPEAAFFGGPIRPAFEATPPAWLAAGWRQVASIYAARDLGAQPLRITRAGDLPYGANFAVRSTLQRRLRYDPRFGRQPVNYWLGGDETEVMRRLLDDGCEGCWVPAATVQHCIAPDRQTLAYVARYAFGEGQTEALRSGAAGRWRFLGSPAWLWQHWASALGRTGFALAARGPEQWLPAFYQAVQLSGRLYAATRRSGTQRGG